VNYVLAVVVALLLTGCGPDEPPVCEERIALSPQDAEVEPGAQVQFEAQVVHSCASAISRRPYDGPTLGFSPRSGLPVIAPRSGGMGIGPDGRLYVVPGPGIAIPLGD
jgi:hypothetical protein